MFFYSGLGSSRSHLWTNQLEAQEMRPEDWPELSEVCFRCVDFLSLSFDCAESYFFIWQDHWTPTEEPGQLINSSFAC